MSEEKNPLNHLGIIMDGNRRWAKKNGLSIEKGYSKGAIVAETILEEAFKNGIRNVSIYLLSSENLHRPTSQINFLFSLVQSYIERKIQKSLRQGVKIKFIGDLCTLPNSLQKSIQKAEDETKLNTKFNLYVAFNYGGQQEILNCFKTMLSNAHLNKVSFETLSSQISVDYFNKHLYAPEMPNLDFVIRTGGDMRISNFLLWKIAYAELFFSDMLWPEFTLEHFHAAMKHFFSRERTFGRYISKTIACNN
ncbi:polyprenyl diphosphate synthase [Candidatus Sneabacter namystus]|uniref:Isoprenyl transferase n=1 Tax=Candidatus Sneabacter namystus TaxID=2601646 RepID=A0A5C0UIY2_9RICK|nr:polyprenyl diphosphate synthase [Candidatus Sneabacter namystus]QEK39571.1 di-trans,poly-cis-decaprenylcistransferase [Candidatus Sneabacter namystus]